MTRPEARTIVRVFLADRARFGAVRARRVRKLVLRVAGTMIKVAISSREEQRMRAQKQRMAVMNVSGYYDVHVSQDGNLLQTLHEARS